MLESRHQKFVTDIHEPLKTDDTQQYILTRHRFLDAVWNRIYNVRFYSTSLHHARIFPLPGRLDRYGRVKVAFAINPDFPKERQAESLAHEMIHVDRNVWDRNTELDFFSYEYFLAREEEEALTRHAAEEFYNLHKKLALLALNHLWLRRIESDEI